MTAATPVIPNLAIKTASIANMYSMYTALVIRICTDGECLISVRQVAIEVDTNSMKFPINMRAPSVNGHTPVQTSNSATRTNITLT